MVHVPLQGATAAIAALLGEQIDVEFGSIGQATPLLQAGKIKVLLVVTARRTSMLPQIPTMTELGLRRRDHRRNAERGGDIMRADSAKWKHLIDVTDTKGR